MGEIEDKHKAQECTVTLNKISQRHNRNKIDKIVKGQNITGEYKQVMSQWQVGRKRQDQNKHECMVLVTLIPAPPNTVSVSVLCWERSSIQVISTHWWSYEYSCVLMNMVHSSEVSLANELALRVSTFSWKLKECCCFFIFCRCGQLGYSIYQDKWKWIFLMKHSHSRENNINLGMLTLFVVLCWFCTYLKRLFKMQCRVMVC